MKNKISYITLLLIGIMIISCDKNDSDYKNDFEKSRKAWVNFKELSNNSYRYVVSSGPPLFDVGWETTITVTDGEITKREFRYTTTEGLADDFPNEELEWSENEDEINSHEDGSAATALTLDEIYYKAQEEWLVNRENVEIFFETKNNGLISTCGYVENGCADGCFRGIRIKSIEAL